MANDQRVLSAVAHKLRGTERLRLDSRVRGIWKDDPNLHLIVID
jgi:hypothetical protein